MAEKSSEVQDLAMATRIDEPLRDNAGNRIPTQWVWRTADLPAAVDAAFQGGHSVMLIGAQTSATNNFGREFKRWTLHTPATGLDAPGIIGLQPRTLASDPGQPLPVVVCTDLAVAPPRPLPTDAIVLLPHAEGPDRHLIRVGAGITFTQVNQALRQHFAADLQWDYCVPVDLTTTDIAQAGAVFATGAQGPSRFRVGDIARSVVLCTGAYRHLTVLDTPETIADHQGCWGMTGAVCELELRVFRRPKHRFGFFVPLTRSSDGSWIEQVAAVLALLRDATTLRLQDGYLQSNWSNGLIDGAEVFARETLELVANTTLPAGPNRVAAQKILQLMQARERSGTVTSQSDFAVYLTGNAAFADLDDFLADETSPLAQLLEYSEHRERFVHAAGIKTIDDERAFEEMRLLRESFADIARQHAKHRAPGQGKPFSESTDINCFVEPAAAQDMDVEHLRAAFRLILQPYYAYEMRIRDLAEVGKTMDITVTMTRYGHLNPRSTNLHTRVTVHAPEDSLQVTVFQQVVQRARDNLLRILKDVSQRYAPVRVEGGEKGKMTAEAWELASPAERDQLGRVLAAADVRFQPHLKGEWAELVARQRGWVQ